MKFLPQSLVGRILIIGFAVLVLSHLVVGIYSYRESQSADQANRVEFISERIGNAVSRLLPLSFEQRVAVLRDDRFMRRFIRLADQNLFGDETSRGSLETALFASLKASLADQNISTIRINVVEGPERGVELFQGRPPHMGRHEGMAGPDHDRGHFFDDRPPPDLLQIAVQFPDGMWMNVQVPLFGPPPLWRFKPFWGMGFVLLLAGIVAAFALYRANKPLEAMIKASERFGNDLNAPPLAETGPREVVRAARAFNQMQMRLQRFVQDRTQMLAAISHDLKTPITRLRLRAELIEGDALREKVLADLSEMEAMIASTLSFARDDGTNEATTALDLGALLESLCEDLSPEGQLVKYDGPLSLKVMAKPLALKRALSNLIDNGLKYGERVEVGLKCQDQGLEIVVRDHGPGIAEAELENVFKPFYRLEASRNRQTGGTGLGLSIVRACIQAQGGNISLRNHPDGGLEARIDLPKGNV